MEISIIEDIFYGNGGTVETIKNSKKYRSILEELDKKEEEFDVGLSEEQRKKRDEIDFLHMGAESETALTYYKEGFKLGLLLAMEAVFKDR